MTGEQRCIRHMAFPARAGSVRLLAAAASGVFVNEFRHQRRPRPFGKPRTSLQTLKAIFKGDDSKVQRNGLPDEFNDFLFKAWTRLYANLGGGAQDEPGRLHRGGKVVEQGGEHSPVVGGCQHSLPALHGLPTRHVAGALVSARRSLQRMGWVRRAVAILRPSGTTNGRRSR